MSSCFQTRSVGVTQEKNMGVDLRLLPFDSDSGDEAYSQTILELGSDYDLHDKIKQLPALPVPPSFRSFSGQVETFEGTCYGETKETPYGEPVLFVRAGDICSIRLKDATYVERAIWAYLKELPRHTKVALYWH